MTAISTYVTPYRQCQADSKRIVFKAAVLHDDLKETVAPVKNVPNN